VGVKVVMARLRPKKDEDIKKALSNLPPYYDESDILREALRQFLFGHKGRIPQLLGSQVFVEEKNSNVAVTIDQKVQLEQIETDDEDELEAALNKFITE
jgi:hypothetical protein